MAPIDEKIVVSEGYSTARPHLPLNSIEGEIGFIKNVFFADVAAEFKRACAEVQEEMQKLFARGDG